MESVAERLVGLLRQTGVKYVFGIPSGPWMSYMEAMRTGGVEFVLVSNEASGGFMADVCARITGIPGACYGTFGPGATNLSTGVGGALLDRSPLLAFTTEPTDAMMGRTMQMAIDHQALFRPITKWTTRMQADRVDETYHRAIHVATSELPGPVHIGLPSDLGGKPAERSSIKPLPVGKLSEPSDAAIAGMISLYKQARKPLLAIGLSAVRAGVQDLVLQIAESHDIPVVLTPMAKGMIPETHRCYSGVLFHALSDGVGETHRQADLVLGVGYDPIEFNYEDWMPDAPLVHMASERADVDPRICPSVCDVVGDLRSTLTKLAGQKTNTDWDMDALADRRLSLFQKLQPPNSESFGPVAALSLLRKALPEDGVLTCDVGAHTHLIGQAWPTPSPGLQIMSNGWSSMGFGIPSAIAAKLCLPDKQVACVTGDGGFLMMVGEMATAMRLGLHVVFVLFTDRRLELIRLKQDKGSFSHYGTFVHGEGYKSADTFFGVPVLGAADAGTYRDALHEAFAMDGPVIVEAQVDGSEYNSLLLKKHR